jgi:hypothetical protein
MSLFTMHTDRLKDRHDEDSSSFWQLFGNAPKMDYNIYCVRTLTVVMCVLTGISGGLLCGQYLTRINRNEHNCLIGSAAVHLSRLILSIELRVVC